MTRGGRRSTSTRRASSWRRYPTKLHSGSRRARFAAIVKRFACAVAGGAFALTSTANAASYNGNLAQAGVVWISDDSKPAPLPEFVMRNTHKSFEPDLAVITAGSTIRFPNDDAFFHSIFSSSEPDSFDIGFYDTGPGKTVAFPRPGVVAVRCHIHGTMHATIVVVDGPWAQTHAPNEKYSLDNVRPGAHVLHTWSADGGEKTTPVKL